MTKNYRLPSATDEKEMRLVKFTFDGRELEGYEGEPIAAALLANGILAFRVCEITGEPRGMYCGIGHCYECRAVVNGEPNVRTCLTPLRQGTTVSSTNSWFQRETEK